MSWARASTEMNTNPSNRIVGVTVRMKRIDSNNCFFGSKWGIAWYPVSKGPTVRVREFHLPFNQCKQGATRQQTMRMPRLVFRRPVGFLTHLNHLIDIEMKSFVKLVAFLFILICSSSRASAQESWTPQQQDVTATIQRLSATTAPDGAGADEYGALSEEFSRWTVGTTFA